jgi:hypothetical protein
MKKRVRIGLVVFLVLCVVWAVSLVLLPQSTRFHGKPASEWIKGITYFGDYAQVKQWRAFGPEGLHLLARALDKGRLHRKAYRWFMPRLPGPINSFLYLRLPKRADAHATRMCVISLLRQLGKDAKPVEPAIARALNDDNSGVRLPRVDALLQARPPKLKDASIISHLDGILEFGSSVPGERCIVVRNHQTGLRKGHNFPIDKHILYSDGHCVRKGEQLTTGLIDPHEILEILGPQKLAEHLVNEIQAIYRLQGVTIHEKHIEIIVRQMLRHVQVTEPGDTRFLSGEQVGKNQAG